MNSTASQNVGRWVGIVFVWAIAFVLLAVLARLLLAVIFGTALLIAMAAWGIWPDYRKSRIRKTVDRPKI